MPTTVPTTDKRDAKVIVDVLGILRKEYETVFGALESDPTGGDARDDEGSEMSECGSPRPTPSEKWCLEQGKKNRADVSRLDAERARLEGLLRAEELGLGELRRDALAAERRASALAIERAELRGMHAELAHCVWSELHAV
jgi:hypothetical protein